MRVAPQSIATIENAWSHWRPEQSRDEFYAEYREIIDQATTQEQNAVTAVRMADPYASNMELVGPLDQIRWAVVSISRDIWNPGNLTNSHLAIIAAADYCRMAAGDFTLATVNEHMRQEGEWQAQHLIHRLLGT